MVAFSTLMALSQVASGSTAPFLSKGPDLGEAWQKDPSPPVPDMPQSFDVTAKEALKFISFWPLPTLKTSSSRWIYDWPSRRAVFAHGRDYESFFCTLNDATWARSCKLYFNGGKLYSWFPQSLLSEKCCILGDSSMGGGMLNYDWLKQSGATYVESRVINGEPCDCFASKGARTLQDQMCFNAAGRICEYYEQLNEPGIHRMDHTISFNVGSWGKVNEQDLSLPATCQSAAKCPHQIPEPTLGLYIPTWDLAQMKPMLDSIPSDTQPEAGPLPGFRAHASED